MRFSSRAELWDTTRATSPQDVTVLSTSSLDDAIDGVNSSEKQALLALYVFADGPAAKYLTQFIRTRVSFVNHIPTTLLSKLKI